MASIAQGTLLSLFNTNNAPKQPNSSKITEVGANYRIWTPVSTNGGPGTVGAHELVELESGMNYWDGQGWTPANAAFQATESGFSADQVQHRVSLSANLNNGQGAVSLTTPDGVTLHSTPVAIRLYDSASGKSAVIAAVTNSIGVQVSSNKIIYPKAFDRVAADVIYTLERGSFEQDVKLTGNINPADYGFSPKTTRIQIMTEFYDPPQPDRMRRPLYVEKSQKMRKRMANPDLIDETLAFGAFAIATGKAYAPAKGTDRLKAADTVTKEFVTVGKRTFLTESVRYGSIERGLKLLPNSNPNPAATSRSGGEASPSIPEAGSTQLASSDLKVAPPQVAQNLEKQRGVVIDYLGVLAAPFGGTLTGTILFRGDKTYFIRSTLYCVGSTTIEGGAVFKYPNDRNPTMIVDGSLTCKTATYHPAIFTAADDDSIGATVGQLDSNGQPIWSGYTGSINQNLYADPALEVMVDGAVLSDFRFYYMKEAIRLDGWELGVTLANSQIISCIRGITLNGWTDPGGSGSDSGSFTGPTPYTVNNILMAYVQYPLVHNSGSIACNLYNCTVDNATQLASGGDPNYASSCSFVNSVLANVTTLTGGPYVTGNHNGFYLAPHFGSSQYVASQTPFQFRDYGGYYLDPAAGFSAIGNLATTTAIKGKTTHPPNSLPGYLDVVGNLTLSPQIARYVSGAPDLGYYYDALDYTVTSMYSQGSIVVEPGTAIGLRNDPDELFGWTFFGFMDLPNSTFVSHGKPDKPNTFVHVQYVQEGPYWPWSTFMVSFIPAYFQDGSGSLPPDFSFRFCNLSTPAENFHLYSGYQLFAPDYGFYSESSSTFLSFRDCNIYEGIIFLDKPADPEGVYAGGAISLKNTLFDRVQTLLDPTPFEYGYDVNVDVSVESYNDLYRGGLLWLDPATTSAGNWVFRDNLFDQVCFFQDTVHATGDPLPLDYDYNAYWKISTALLLEYHDGLGYPSTIAFADTLTPNNNDGGTDGVHDKVLTSAPFYSSSYFGNFYLLNGSATFNALHHAGSRTPAQAGLYQYTIRTDQVKDGQEAGAVNIGLHYVAGVSPGLPKDSDNDGVPDYVADADGNGVTDATDNTPPPPGTQFTKAHNDVFQVQQGSGTTQLKVLPNDVDSEGFHLTIWFPYPSLVKSGGTLAPTLDHLNVNYTTPNGTFYGVQQFTYAMVNDFNRVSSAYVRVYVNKTGNNPPIAINDTFIMGPSDTSITLSPLANDSDPDADTISLVSVDPPQLGTAQISGNNIIYTRAVTIAGTDVFNYTITDGNGGVAVGAIQVSRQTGGNHAPVAFSYATTAVQNSPLNVHLLASDPDNDPLVYSVLQSPQHGTLTAGISPSEKIYTSIPGYYGPDFFTFKVNDGTLDSPTAIVVIHVKDRNSAPVAYPESISVIPNTLREIILPGSDADGDYLTYTIVDNPVHGALSGTPPYLTYAPAAGYGGADSFTYKVNDGKEDSAVATISITVGAPAQRSDLFVVSQGVDNWLNVLQGKFDPSGGSLTVSAVGAANYGTVAISADQMSVVYTPGATYHPEDTFTYTTMTSGGATRTYSVKVFVNASGSSPPTAVDDTATLDALNQTADINVLANDYSSGALQLYWVETPRKGFAADNGSGGVTYARDPARPFADTFAYVITDGAGGFAIGHVTVDQLDSDDDGIPDYYEVTLFHTDPFNPDTGHSGLADGDKDFSGDGMSNIQKLTFGINPFVYHEPMQPGGALPAWAQQAITAKTGDPSPTPTGDSDGDGVDNATELARNTSPADWDPPPGNSTDPAAPGDAEGYFEVVQAPPDYQPGDVTPPEAAYLHFTMAGFDNMVAEFDLARDTGANGSSKPGFDTFKFKVSAGDENAWWDHTVTSLNDPNAQPEPEDEEWIHTLILKSCEIGGEAGHDVMEAYAKLSESLHHLSEKGLVYVQYRSVQEITVQMRVLKVYARGTAGAVLRVRRAIAIIQTETTVLRAVTFELGMRFPGAHVAEQFGRFFKGVGMFFQVLSFYNDFNSAWPLVYQYLIDRFRECDSGASSDLAGYALGVMFDDLFPGFIYTGGYYLGERLCKLNPGCDSTCN